MRVLSADAMRALDAAACARDGATELMRRAGRAIAHLVRFHAPRGRVVGVAGRGDNGGDVFAALAELEADRERIVVALDTGGRVSEARRDAERRAREAGVRVAIAGPDACETLLAAPGCFLDGLLGVGARPGLNDELRALTRALNLNRDGVTIAIDLPTGLDATSGGADPDTVNARATIALGALKLGLLLENGRPHVGDLWFDDIGMASGDLTAPGTDEYFALDEREAALLLPRRRPDTEKRTAGAPLLIAGSEQFPGAAALCARAAARAGAGYVTVATPRAAASTLRAHLVEQVVIPFDDDDPASSVAAILDAAKRCGSIAIGPGLGLSKNMGEIVRGTIAASTLPMVIDASGLFHLAKHLDLLRGKRAVLTPHAGEFGRLSGKGIPAASERLARLRAFVREHGVTTLLKGQTTLIDDGTRVALNTTGTAALATAGTGDVLTGMTATLLAQGIEPASAATLAAYWHGRAGHLAEQRRPIGTIAGDLPELLGEAMPRLRPLERPMHVW